MQLIENKVVYLRRIRKKSKFFKIKKLKKQKTMKKILFVAAFAFILAACGGQKEAGICVDKFYENPIGNLGKDIAIVGQAKICGCTGAMMIVNCTSEKFIRVAPVEGVVIPENVKDAYVLVKGIVSEEVIDEAYVLALAEKANAIEDETEKLDALAKAEKIGAIIIAEGVIRNYTIDATSIELTKACCDKKGDKCCDKKHEGCDKKCDGKHEGCDKKCEGKHEGCEKKCEGKTEGCEKKCEGKKAE